MNIALPRIHADEVTRFGLIVALFFFNSVILESNEVIATSGFISNIGVQHVVWVWAADMLVVMLTAALYSIVVDRTDRARLATTMFALFGLIYLVLYGLFRLEYMPWLVYPLLTVVNDQQWSLFGLLIWALANDAFSTAQAKRLFPLLAMAVMVGSVVGNATVTLVPRALQAPGYILLLLNSLILLTLFLLMVVTLMSSGMRAQLLATVRSARHEGGLREVFTEGTGFIRDVPVFRYLAFAMIPLGFGLNTLEFHFLSTIATADVASVQTVYGTFKVILSVTVLIAQGFFTTQLINKIGLRRVFSLMPMVQIGGLFLVFLSPLYGILLGNYLTRATLLAVDEPARQMLYGMAPDERRGRVSAFMNGYLYPLGAIGGCLLIGTVMVLIRLDLLTLQLGQAIYLGAALLCVAFAYSMVIRLFRTYDTSLLSWRLDRRKRRSTIPNLEF
jgi:ATP/ADP translocase